MKEGGRWPLFFFLCVCQYAQVFFKKLVKMTIDLQAGKWYIIITRNEEQAKGREGQIEMMDINEMKEYLLCELKEERYKMLMNQENKYSYLFMLCNDMGIIEEQ